MGILSKTPIVKYYLILYYFLLIYYYASKNLTVHSRIDLQFSDPEICVWIRIQLLKPWLDLDEMPKIITSPKCKCTYPSMRTKVGIYKRKQELDQERKEKFVFSFFLGRVLVSLIAFLAPSSCFLVFFLSCFL